MVTFRFNVLLNVISIATHMTRVSVQNIEFLQINKKIKMNTLVEKHQAKEMHLQMAGTHVKGFNFPCNQSNAKIVFSPCTVGQRHKGCREMDKHTLMLIGIALPEDSLLPFLKSILKSICL